MKLRTRKYNESNDNIKSEIKRIYLESFPKDERFEFYILSECSKEKNSELYAIMDNNNVIGMSYVVKYKDENNIDLLYLMYFAIDLKYRGMGYASNYLKYLNNSNVLLCIEKPSIKDIYTSKRKQFYLRNGFYETKIFFDDSGVDYEILTTLKGYIPSEKCMLKRYGSMSNDKGIIEVINNSFNTKTIKFEKY